MEFGKEWLLVELRCDNSAAIVLATGEGSWKTKSAANKVCYIKEQVAVSYTHLTLPTKA